MGKNKIIRNVSIVCFCVAGAMFALGMVITFYPGAEKSFYIFLCLLLIVSMILSPNKIIKIISVILLIISVFGAYNGHKRGVEYRQFLENRNK